jgi:hypothetical protein
MAFAVTVVRGDHGQRLEKSAKSDRCGHSPVFDNAKRLEIVEEQLGTQNRGVGGSKKVGSEGAKARGKRKSTVVKPTPNDPKTCEIDREPSQTE